MSSNAQRFTAFLVAAVVVIALADVAPTIVNGVLLLILGGVVLSRSGQWVPLVQSWGNKVNG